MDSNISFNLFLQEVLEGADIEEPVKEKLNDIWNQTVTTKLHKKDFHKFWQQVDEHYDSTSTIKHIFEMAWNDVCIKTGNTKPKLDKKSDIITIII
jgi:hypothetical protein